jgi:hypothetical protein
MSKRPARVTDRRPSAAVTDRLLGVAADRHRRRYPCGTCDHEGANESIRRSLDAMLADPPRFARVTMSDVRRVLRDETGCGVEYEAFLAHLRNHEPLYAKWRDRRGAR